VAFLFSMRGRFTTAINRAIIAAAIEPRSARQMRDGTKGERKEANGERALSLSLSLSLRLGGRNMSGAARSDKRGEAVLGL